MNSRYKPGDYEARHLEPVWRHRADFVIAADIASSPEKGEWEQLWARQISENRFEICCIPFFVYDLALGDVVETDRDHVFHHVACPSGHQVFRVWFGDVGNASDRFRIAEMLRNQGCELEWSSENLLAVDASTDELARAVGERLVQLQEEGRLTFETGRTV
jgi:hypothetical protein